MSGAPYDGDNWDRIQQLFDAAVDLPRPQRDAFLCRECAGDDRLRKDIESLVDCDADVSLIGRIVDDAMAALCGGPNPGSGGSPGGERDDAVPPLR